MDYINNEKLIEDVKTIIKIPNLRAALFHKVEEYKSFNMKKIEEYRDLENIVDPGKKGKTGEPLKKIGFEIRKEKAGWMVNPVDIPREIVKHITNMDLTPGIIKMQKFNIGGRHIDLSFEMQSQECFIGSIIEKSTGKANKETPGSQERKPDKTEDLKTFITYLFNNETLYNWMMSEFFDNWKPLIDNGCIKTNER
jgi:hypothetical protein